MPTREQALSVDFVNEVSARQAYKWYI